MARFALINLSNLVDRLSTSVLPTVQTKTGWKWLPCDPVSPPSFDPTIEKITGPTYTVGASLVTEVWTKVSLTAQEISDAKDAAVNGLNGTNYKALLQMLLTLENEVRDLRTKLNAEIVSAGRVAPYTAGQSASINAAQLKAAIKALL